MRYLKIYENYQTEEERIFEAGRDGYYTYRVSKICEKYGITNWSINQDGLVDVNGDVDLAHKGLTELPLKFGIVSGYFWCYSNKLTTLEGAPYSVGEDFFCSYNNLTTLKYSPQSVSGYFSCDNNKLTTIEGAPYSVGEDFFCYNNPLPDLIQNNMKWIKHIIANQYIYHIYNKDGSIHEYRFRLMIDSME